MKYLYDVGYYNCLRLRSAVAYGLYRANHEIKKIYFEILIWIKSR